MMLSFIVPAYNCAHTVAEAINSALSQRLSVPIEIVTVDDGSTDGTPAVLSSLAEQHPEVRTGRNESNLGGGATRNRAIALARGDLLYMLDSDNVLPPEVVQPQLDLLLGSRSHAVSVERLVYFRDEISNVVDDWRLLQRDGRSGIREAFTSGVVPASHGNYLYTRHLFDEVGGYEEAPALDTWTFGMKHVLRGMDVAIAPGTFYYHRVSHDSYWMRAERRGENDPTAIRFLKAQLDLLPPYLQERVGALRDDEPFFKYLHRGAFTHDGRFPGPLRRLAARVTAKAVRVARRAASARRSVTAG